MTQFIKAATPKFLQKIIPDALLGSDLSLTPQAAPTATPPPPPPASTPEQTAAVTAPPAGSTTESQKSAADLASKGGFRSNLFTGGLGLKSLNQANLSKRKLGLG